MSAFRLAAKPLIYVVSTALALVCCVRGLTSYDVDEPVKGDAGGYVATAYNVYSLGVFSHQCENFAVPCEVNEVVPTNNREVLYPLYLAMALSLYPEKIERAMLFPEPHQMNPDIHRYLRRFTMATIIGAALFAAGIAFLVTHSFFASLLTMTLVATSPTLVENVKYFLTENLACMLLSGVVFFAMLAYVKRSIGWIAVAGVMFGLLALTKSIYCYAFYIVLLVSVVQLWWRRSVAKELGKALLAFVVCYGLVVGSWATRNFFMVGSTSISNRGGSMLVIRAYYGRVNFEEFKSLFWYQTPLREWIAPSPETLELVKRVDRSNPDGFYRASKEYGRVLSKQLGATEAEKVLKKEAVDEIMANPLKHLAVSVALLVNGLFVEGNKWVMGSLVLSRLQMGAILLGTLVLMGIWAGYRRDVKLILVIAPIWFSVTIHSLVSNSLPRYNEPTLGLFCAAVVILIYSGARSFLRLTIFHSCKKESFPLPQS